MKPKMIWANLGVSDVEKTRKFYLALGFDLNGKPAMNLVSFKFGDSGFIIHFFEKEKFKSSLEGEMADLSRGNEIMFTLSAQSREEIHEMADKVKGAGGNVHFDPRQDKKEFYEENGYHVCVFSDRDGHKFNLFYNEDQ